MSTRPRIVPEQSDSHNSNEGDGWRIWGRHIRSEQDRQREALDEEIKDRNRVTVELSVKIAHLEARVALLLLLLPISITVALAIAGFIFNWLSKK